MSWHYNRTRFQWEYRDNNDKVIATITREVYHDYSQEVLDRWTAKLGIPRLMKGLPV